ncbi:MAG: ABC transporter ATP-binding protein [Acidobacteriota bacterium]
MMQVATEKAAALLEAREVVRTFGAITAVDGVSLAVGPGEILGLVGPDGAGKTTLLRLLAGLLEPSAGEILFQGENLEGILERARERVGYMPQKFGLYLDLTVNENLDFFADLYGLAPEVLAEKKRRLLGMTRMEPFRDRRAGHLSGGMKQKLGLMGVLLHEPAVLLLDEPTNGVDPISRREFWVILGELAAQGVAIVISTAYLDEADRCSRVALLHRGRLLACEAPQRLRDRLPGRTWRIRVADWRKAQEALRRTDGVRAVRVAGRDVKVWSEVGVGPERLRAALEAAGCSGAEVAPEPPAVEDVFVWLTEEKSGLEG